MRLQLMTIGFLSLLLSLCVGAVYADETVAVGSFHVPLLLGWQSKVNGQPATDQTVTSGGQSHKLLGGMNSEVELIKQIAGDTISLDFRVDGPPPGGVVHTRPDTQLLVFLMKTDMSPAYYHKEMTRFLGHSAYLSQRKDPDPDHKGMIDTRAIVFFDQGQMYTVQCAIQGLKITSSTRAEADKGWQALKQGVASLSKTISTKPNPTAP